MKVTINITPAEENAMRSFIRAIVIGDKTSLEDNKHVTSVISKVFVAADPAKRGHIAVAAAAAATEHHTRE